MTTTCPGVVLLLINERAQVVGLSTFEKRGVLRIVYCAQYDAAMLIKIELGLRDEDLTLPEVLYKKP